MATVYKEVSVVLRPDEPWKRVSDLGAISELLEVVVESKVDGQTRTCTLQDGGRLKETIVGVDETRRRVAYAIQESPFPLEFHAASMQVREGRRGGSTLVWIMDLLPDGLAPSFQELMDREMAKLSVRI